MAQNPENDPLNPSDLATAVRVLSAIAEDRTLMTSMDREERATLQRLAGQVAQPDVIARRKLQRALRKKDKARRRDQDESQRHQTGIRQLRDKPVFVTPTPELMGSDPGDDEQERDEPALNAARICYACKAEYTAIHGFYDQMCKSCGDLNYQKRAPRFDLRGRVALLTGGRLKIGFHAGILLLRNGCDVVVTTRFPKDAAARYAREPDFSKWSDRLHIYGLDLRHTPSVETLAKHLATSLKSLDFVIHNACQTVRRPPEYYAHLLDGEERSVAALPEGERQLLAGYDALLHSDAGQSLLAPAPLSQVTTDSDPLLTTSGGVVEIFPRGELDADLQQVDLREQNSWRLRHHEVPTVELLEVLLVNAVGPFVLSARLKPLMLRTPTRDKHIVNVSAMEGQFHRNKTDKHPHTNMAKAALNMLTRTAAQDFLRDGIHMNSVDTGWITDEDPAHLTRQKEEMHRFSPPLDVVDGAARIVDPIFVGLQTGKHPWGQFFKDYLPTHW